MYSHPSPSCGVILFACALHLVLFVAVYGPRNTLELVRLAWQAK